MFGDYAYAIGETNKHGLTWPDWYARAVGDGSYAVSAQWSPVLTTHERAFKAWRTGINPEEFRKAEMELSQYANRKLRVLTGSKALDIPIRAVLRVVSVEALGAEYSHAARVIFEHNGKRRSLHARHPNRLGDGYFILNNGDPTKKIAVSFMP